MKKKLYKMYINVHNKWQASQKIRESLAALRWLGKDIVCLDKAVVFFLFCYRKPVMLPYKQSLHNLLQWLQSKMYKTLHNVYHVTYFAKAKTVVVHDAWRKLTIFVLFIDSMIHVISKLCWLKDEIFILSQALNKEKMGVGFLLCLTFITR